jgi:hypothetical protein
MADLDGAIQTFWSNIEGHITADIDTYDVQYTRVVWEEISTAGASLCELLFPEEEIRANVRSLAEESDVLIIFSKLSSVPWEALVFVSEGGHARLGDLCVITRVPNGHPDKRGFESAPVALLSNQAILLDSALCETHDSDGVEIGRLREIGVNLIMTKSRQDIIDIAKTVDIIHWFCEHEFSSGLRLAKDLFYKMEDAIIFRFRSGSLVILTTCAGGREFGQGNFAGMISYRSNCTVVSSQCSVLLKSGVMFVRQFHDAIRKLGNESVEFWRFWKDFTAMPTGRDMEETGARFDIWRKIVQTLYCIHGPIDLIVGARDTKSGQRGTENG